jgi:putative DNA primase/helicase
MATQIQGCRVMDGHDDFMQQVEREAELGDGVHLEVVDARPPEFSDEALALRFSAKHADEARYVSAWSRWLLWDGIRWDFDTTMRAFDFARTICRVASSEADQPKLAAAIASAKTVSATVSLARADRRHAATVGQWDADAWSLNTL